MKKIILISLGLFLMHLHSFAIAPLYFLLDHQSEKQYSEIISDYHGYEIQTFNVFLDKDKSSLVLFSVLPSLDSKKILWKQIDLDTLNVELQTPDSLSNIIRMGHKLRWYLKLTQRKYFWADPYWGMKMARVHIIIKRNNKYYMNEQGGYLEFFEIMSNTSRTHEYTHFMFPPLNYTYRLNIFNKENIHHIADFENKCLQIYHRYSGNHPKVEDLPNSDDKPFLMRDSDTTLFGKSASRFWTYAGWVIDGSTWERGIDRLTYMSDIGIVAGAYTPHFKPIGLSCYYSKEELEDWRRWIEYDYMHNIQSTPLRIELNGKLVYEKKK